MDAWPKVVRRMQGRVGADAECRSVGKRRDWGDPGLGWSEGGGCVAAAQGCVGGERTTPAKSSLWFFSSDFPVLEAAASEGDAR